LQVELCDPCLSALSVPPWPKKRYINTLPFLFLSIALYVNQRCLHNTWARRRPGPANFDHWFYRAFAWLHITIGRRYRLSRGFLCNRLLYMRRRYQCCYAQWRLFTTSGSGTSHRLRFNRHCSLTALCPFNVTFECNCISQLIFFQYLSEGPWMTLPE